MMKLLNYFEYMSLDDNSCRQKHGSEHELHFSDFSTGKNTMIFYFTLGGIYFLKRQTLSCKKKYSGYLDKFNLSDDRKFLS